MIKPKTMRPRGQERNGNKSTGLTEVDTGSSRSKDDHTDANSADGVTRGDDDGAHCVEGEGKSDGDGSAGQVGDLGSGRVSR